MSSSLDWDVVVVGGGHAGSEAAHAAARRGARTLLVSLEPERIGFMSCNPAMGGLAKGQLIKEIDALGGIMGRNTDATAIQYRRLNSSKGPAVRSSRAQCDKALYASAMQARLSGLPGLSVLKGEVSQVRVEAGRITGVVLGDGTRLACAAVVVTSGTFLSAVMHMGAEQVEGGRLGDRSAKELSAVLKDFGFRLRRLKTGTPPRLLRQSIDWTRTEEQPGDAVPIPFSFYERFDHFPVLPQVSCFITYTNAKTHEVIERAFDRSPLFTGVIQGVGPRYCPSIEDKVSRFRDRDRHQLFLEPEGLTTDEIYVNGISTSLPKDVQEQFVWSIEGLEQAQFVRYGYAVEYDAIDATQLKATLESKDIPGLFFAGQVNGTSGYEEAGAQGLVAGINAASVSLGLEPFTLSRLDGYIGVMIDDLVLKGSDEPYRMFTSRAEYRLLLREDNADLRLSPMGHALGLLSDGDFERFCRRRDQIADVQGKIASTYFYPTEEGNAARSAFGITPLKDRVSAEALLKRPEVTLEVAARLGALDLSAFPQDVLEQVEIQTKYSGYIQREMDAVASLRKEEGRRIPVGFDFDVVPGLSSEVRAKLKNIRPETLGQASRISGVTPAAVAGLHIFLSSRERRSSEVRGSAP